MERRTFLKTTLTALAAQGCLPLLAADKKKVVIPSNSAWTAANAFIEPCAIRPLTEVLPEFTPVAGAAMTGAFSAKYALSTWFGTRVKVNAMLGSMELSFTPTGFQATEIRKDKNGSDVAFTIKTDLKHGKDRTAMKWTQEAISGGREDTRLVETGGWNGNKMAVRSKSFSRKYVTQNQLIHRWGLLPLLASGQMKQQPLRFDMLDDSALRSNQTLSYEGEIEIPVKGGTATLDSYVQTGYGIVPTHYLVDQNGRVQLITGEAVSWILSA